MWLFVVVVYNGRPTSSEVFKHPQRHIGFEKYLIWFNKSHILHTVVIERCMLQEGYLHGLLKNEHNYIVGRKGIFSYNPFSHL